MKNIQQIIEKNKTKCKHLNKSSEKNNQYDSCFKYFLCVRLNWVMMLLVFVCVYVCLGRRLFYMVLCSSENEKKKKRI